jgi:hypothetical protein
MSSPPPARPPNARGRPTVGEAAAPRQVGRPRRSRRSRAVGRAIHGQEGPRPARTDPSRESRPIGPVRSIRRQSRPRTTRRLPEPRRAARQDRFARPQQGQVDHQATVGDAHTTQNAGALRPGRRISIPVHAPPEPSPRSAEHVHRAITGRPPVDHRVPDRAGGLVLVGSRLEPSAGEAGSRWQPVTPRGH